MNQQEYMDSEFPDEAWNKDKKPSLRERFSAWKAKAPERQKKRREDKLESLAYESQKVGLQADLQAKRARIQESQLSLQQKKLAMQEHRTRAFQGSPFGGGGMGGGSMFASMNKNPTRKEALSFNPYTFNPWKEMNKPSVPLAPRKPVRHRRHKRKAKYVWVRKRA